MNIKTSRFYFYSVVSVFMFTVIGCASEIKHDQRLDQNSNRIEAPVALKLAASLSANDLSCPAAKVKVLKVKDNEGAPLGPVWSDYEILAEGCGKMKTYNIDCAGYMDNPKCYLE
jgi:hypothetical protein